METHGAVQLIAWQNLLFNKELGHACQTAVVLFQVEDQITMSAAGMDDQFRCVTGARRLLLKSFCTEKWRDGVGRSVKD